MEGQCYIMSAGWNTSQLQKEIFQKPQVNGGSPCKDSMECYQGFWTLLTLILLLKPPSLLGPQMNHGQLLSLSKARCFFGGSKDDFFLRWQNDTLPARTWKWMVGANTISFRGWNFFQVSNSFKSKTTKNCSFCRWKFSYSHHQKMFRLRGPKLKMHVPPPRSFGKKMNLPWNLFNFFFFHLKTTPTWRMYHPI